MEEDQYRTISGSSKGVYKEKGSKFIAIARPVDSLDNVRSQLEQIRKQYHDARHHCYAYKIGKDSPEIRYNDDGEPSGTAGKPIFGQIESFGLTNLLIVVIRYFGGVKLGTGGLIQAYRSAARDALEGATIITNTIKLSFSVNFPYEVTSEVMRIIQEEDLEIIDQQFTHKTFLTLLIRKLKFQRVVDRFFSIDGINQE